MTDAIELLSSLEALGGVASLENGEVSLCFPEDRERAIAPIVEKLRERKVEVLQILQAGSRAPGTCPPLPRGVRLLKYQPKVPPVAIAPVSIVTDMDKFIKTCLAELDARLNHPIQIRAGGSAFEILAKLAEVGVELALEVPRKAGTDQD